MSKQRHIEISGLQAKYPDRVLDCFSLGYYPFFLRRVVRDLRLRPGEMVLDFGTGTGRFAALFARQVVPTGKVTGVDINEESRHHFQKRRQRNPNMEYIHHQIEADTTFPGQYKRVFISFVLHKFEHFKRILIIQNAHGFLAPGGELALLDWNEHSAKKRSGLFWALFKRFECDLAQDFVERDWKVILMDYGFSDFREYNYLGGHVRLIRCRKY